MTEVLGRAGPDLPAIEARRARIRDQHRRPAGERPVSSARGLHHTALDFPGLDLAPYREVLGGLHDVAISMEPSRWQEIVRRLDQAGLDYVLHRDVSVYSRDPDGARLELIADPLGEMYGHQVLS